MHIADGQGARGTDETVPGASESSKSIRDINSRTEAVFKQDMAIRLRTKIMLSFASLLLLLFIFSAVSYHNRNLLHQGTFKLIEGIYETYIISGLQLHIDMAVMPPNDYLITGDTGEQEKFVGILIEVEREFDQLEGIVHEEHKSLVKGARERFALLREKAEEIFRIQRPVGDPGGMRLMKEIDALASDIIRNHLEGIHHSIKKEVAGFMEVSDHNQKRVDMLMVTEAVVTILVACLLILYLIQSVLKPLHSFTEGAIIIGNGNLDHRIDVKDGLEINILAQAFNRMTGNLKRSYAEMEKKVEERTRELSDLNARLRELSITDGITSLYNTRYFYERLQEEMKRALRHNRPLSLIMADIDHFKEFNDTYGHLEGDNVLRKVAACIKGSIRETDIAARYGGEEFAVILPETDGQGTHILAERIRSSVMNCTCYMEGLKGAPRLTISVGFATFPGSAIEKEELIKMADEALYRAKRMGRNRVEGIGFNRKQEATGYGCLKEEDSTIRRRTV